MKDGMTSYDVDEEVPSVTETVNDALTNRQVFVTFTRHGSDGMQVSIAAGEVARIEAV
jgi:hypothetical protein